MDVTYASDSQWRYDELNHQVRKARWYDENERMLAEPQKLSFDDVKRLINFLEPRCAREDCTREIQKNCYHSAKYKNEVCKTEPSAREAEIPIEGILSVFDLKNRIVESYFGYYGDPWVKLRLMEYVGAEQPAE